MAPKKKFTITLNKVAPPPEDFDEKNWEVAFNAVRSILSPSSQGTPSNNSYSSDAVCTAVRLLCESRNGDFPQKMYDELTTTFEAHAEVMVAEIVKNSEAEKQALLMLVNVWTSMCRSARTIGSLFMYLDCDFMARKTQDQSIYRMAQRIAGRALKRHQEVIDGALRGFLHQIESERNGDLVDRTMLSGFRSVCIALQTYFSEVEPQVLEGTMKYYEHEATKLIHADCVSQHEYLLAVQKRLEEERDRLSTYLDPQSRPRVTEVVQTALLKNMIPQVVDAEGFKELAKTDEYNGLQLAFHLSQLRYVGLSDFVRRQFREYVITSGKAVLATVDDTMISRMIQLKDTIEAIISSAFASNDQFKLTMRESFGDFIRPKQNKTAELLAKYVDSYLKEGSVKCSETEAESALSAAMKIFDFVSSKDLFEAFYTKDFAKRLAFQRSASMDNERFVIRKLRAICGPSLPMRLEGMIKDTELSKELNTTARDAIGRVHERIDVNISVYTQGYWPQYEMHKPEMPEELGAALKKFGTFYNSKHQGRVLNWLHIMSTCTVKGSFPKSRAKEIQMSFIQGLTLLQFNSEDLLTYKEIKERTSLQGEDFDSALISLSVPPQKLLIREGGTGKQIDDDEVFRFNADFQHKLIRFKINQIAFRDTTKEDQETTERVFAERAYAVDAAIVRFMKSRRRASHHELCGEMGKLVNFPVSVVDIKKRVECMIEREYIKRDDNDPSTYEYLA